MKLRIPIGAGAFELEITVDQVCKLLPHEEVIPSYLEALTRAFAASSFQRNPVIVDAHSNVILDGTHRWAAMKELGFRWIAVCKVDYSNPLIELDSWARAFEPAGSGLERVLRKFGAELVGLDEVGESDLAVITSRLAFRIPHSGLADAFEKLRQLDREMRELVGRAPSYVPRSSWRCYASSSLLLAPPRPRKPDVVKAAREGYLMPPKSTRHIIPARPMGVNVPLKLLKMHELDTELIEGALRQKRPLLVNPPVLLDREYQEFLVMFN